MEPSAVDEAAIARELAEVNATLRRISQTLTRHPEAQADETEVERIEFGDTSKRIRDIGRTASEVRCVQAKRDAIGDGNRDHVIKKLAAGVSYRTIVHADILRNAEIAEYFQLIHRLGDHHRVVNEPVQHMVIVDRRAAFVPAVPGDPQVGALLIRQPGMVATLIDLFEHLWTRGVDLEPAGGGGVGDQTTNPLPATGRRPELTDVERQVLDLLIRVDKDETAAREMGVSVRTFRRHVASLMDRLGAANRFHAAYLARERGWI